MSASKRIVPNGKRLKAIRKQAKTVRKQTVKLRTVSRKALKQREKRAIKTERAISPRYQADLIMPGVPFAVEQMEGVLDSTAICNFDYDPLTLTLKVQFWRSRIRKGKVVSQRPGSVYIYFQVPEKVHQEFIRASSKGRYFYYNIR